jgi:hypothetical protein
LDLPFLKSELVLDLPFLKVEKMEIIISLYYRDSII